MPNNSKEYDDKSAAITSLFVGDPSFFAFNGNEEDEAPPEDPDAPPPERFREMNRLSYTVKVCHWFEYVLYVCMLIDNYCTVICDSVCIIYINITFAIYYIYIMCIHCICFAYVYNKYRKSIMM